MSTLYIAGAWQDGQGEAFESLNPVTQHVLWAGKAIFYCWKAFSLHKTYRIVTTLILVSPYTTLHKLNGYSNFSLTTPQRDFIFSSK